MQERIKRLAVEFGDASVDAKGRTEYAFDNHVNRPGFRGGQLV
jgi:hypothetical protein